MYSARWEAILAEGTNCLHAADPRGAAEDVQAGNAERILCAAAHYSGKGFDGSKINTAVTFGGISQLGKDFEVADG